MIVLGRAGQPTCLGSFHSTMRRPGLSWRIPSLVSLGTVMSHAEHLAIRKIRLAALGP